MDNYHAEPENDDLVWLLFDIGDFLEHIKNNTQVPESIKKFQNHFQNIDVKKICKILSQNRNVNDPYAQYWHDSHLQLRNNLAKNSIIEILDDAVPNIAPIIIEISDDDAPNVDPLICDQPLMNNQFNQQIVNEDMTSLSDSGSCTTEAENEDNYTTTEIVKKKRKKKNTTNERNCASSGELSASNECPSSPIKKRKKRITNREVPKETCNDYTSEDLDNYSSYNPKSYDTELESSDESLELDKKRVKS